MRYTFVCIESHARLKPWLLPLVWGMKSRGRSSNTIPANPLHCGKYHGVDASAWRTHDRKGADDDRISHLKNFFTEDTFQIYDFVGDLYIRFTPNPFLTFLFFLLLHFARIAEMQTGNILRGCKRRFLFYFTFNKKMKDSLQFINNYLLITIY